MAAYILRMEGVDFGATIDDTHNLSAFRGGSLALLAAPKAVCEFLKDKGLREEIFAGASQGAWAVEIADDKAEKLRADVREHLGKDGASETAESVWQHLSFVVDIAQFDAMKKNDDFRALKQAEANNRERQFLKANWVLPEFDNTAKGSHATLDRMRPAPPDCFVDTPAAKGKPVSLSFKARFDYGKFQRNHFYEEEAGMDAAYGLDFAKSFEEIIDQAPEGVSASIGGKIAVFYADGNKFSKIREEAGSIDGVRDFSSTVRLLQQELLGKILKWLRDGASGENWGAYVQYPSKGKRDIWPLRFETLLWGGDELIFVMPAWLGIEFARKFFEWTEETKEGKRVWEFDKTPLTFAAGLVFCHEKTPIRSARKVAEAMANEAKKTLGGEYVNVLQIEAFESIALPEYENGLENYRAAMFEAQALAAWLTLRGEDIARALDRIEQLKNGAFPRSQLYWLLRMSRDEKLFLLAATNKASADTQLTDDATSYFKRKGLDPVKELPKLQILPNAPLAYSLAAAAALWDYVDPLKDADAGATEEAA